MKKRPSASLRVIRRPAKTSVSLAAAVASVLAAQGGTVTWDGQAGDSNLGTALNWSGDVLPSLATPDTAEWSGVVAGPLTLLYSDASFAGVAGNTGVNLSLTGAQTSSLNIDAGANTSSFRLNNVTIAAGAGAFSLGDGANTFNLTLGGVAGQTHTWTNDSTNTATIAADVVFGLGGGGTHTLALGGAGNWALNNVVSGAITLTKNGNGTLTLTGTNTLTGGVVLNAGKLNFNNAAAAGNTAAGALIITGGTLDNTSGGALTTTTAKAMNWNGDFTFAGTNNLNFNGGVVTLGGAGQTRTLTASAGTFTVGSLVGIGYGLTKTGAGTLTMGSAVGRITGDLNVNGGVVQIGLNDFIAGGSLNGSGTLENGSGTTRWMFVGGNTNGTFTGTLQNGTGAGLLGFVKGGPSTQTIAGPATYTSETVIDGGTLEFGSSTLTGAARTVSTSATSGLLFERGDGVVKSSTDGTGTATLTFGSRLLRTAGGTGNFVISGGTNGSTNSIFLTQAAGFISQGNFFGGDNYAWMDNTNTYVREMRYGSDSGAVTSGTTASLASATHQEFTGDITAQGTATFTTLKDNGNNAFTLASGSTVTTNGILKTGNVAGGATISGGTGLQTTAAGELVIRVNGSNDALTISTPILANGASTVTTSGAGTLTLGATNTYTGVTTVNGGVVNVSGSLATGLVDIVQGTMNLTGTINPSNANNGQFNVGAGYHGGVAVLNINGGTLNAGKNTNPSLAIGGRGNANALNDQNVAGIVHLNSGTINTANEFHVGNGSGGVGSNAYAAFTMSGGTLNSASWVAVGLNNDRAILNQSGGTINVNANRMTIGAGNNAAFGVVNLSGGNFNDNAGIFVGEVGTGYLNVSGTASLNLGTAGTLLFGNNAASVFGSVNLLGGTINANSVVKSGASTTGVYRFNFNGGTLRPTVTNAAFFASSAQTQAIVYGGGAIVDTNTFDATIAQPLIAPTGSGLTSLAVASGGAGYLEAPVVQISGGSGVGAQAVANVAGGVLTGFTITSPGTGYLPTDTLSVVLFSGGSSAPATVGTVTLGTVASGGFTKNGNGILTLSGANSFTGNITVNAGTLRGTAGIVGNPITSSFGNNTVPGRTITVAPGATLELAVNDVFGNATAVAANLPTVIVNGTFNTTRYNQVGAITLNGGTLSNNNTTDSGTYQSYQFLGDLTVTGSAPSFITSGSAEGFNGNHLSTLTTFNVADVTNNANTDLLVSAPFRNQSPNYAQGAGGFAKTGAGKMELTAVSTFTGPVNVNGGTLLVSGAGSINTSSGITINGTGAKLVATNFLGTTPTITLTNGTVDGTTTLGTVNVANLATNTIANGDGSAASSLTINALTFLGAGKFSLLANGLQVPVATGTLTTSGTAGAITIDATNTTWTNGQVYDLISYGTLTGSLADFTKGTIAGLGARQSATLGNSGAAITLAIAGDLPLWTGAGDHTWSTAVQSPKNWKLQTGGSTTDFLTNDTVLFEDSQSVNTNVSITANVSPVSTTFDNSSKSYVVTSAGGFGITSGSLTKNGTGALTLGGVHTYTGATQINNGTLNLTGTLGNTAVAVAFPATLNLQAANAISQNVVTVDGTLTQSVDNALTGTAALVLNSGATFARPNTYSGGTALNSGTFNLNHPTALGTGPITLSTVTLDNTSGAAVTMTANNPLIFKAGVQVDFTGTNALNLGAGAVSLGQDASTALITLNNNSALAGTSLTIGGNISAPSGGTAGLKTLYLLGSGNTALTGNITPGAATGVAVSDNLPGTLTLSGAANALATLNLNGGAGSIVDIGAGTLGLANGGGNVLQSTTGGTINATGGGQITVNSANGDFGTAGGTTLTVNARLAGNQAIDFYNANGGPGLGTIILTAANTHTGAFNVENERVVLPAGSAYNAGNVAGSGQVTVGTVSALSAVLDVNGGTVNATKTASTPSLLTGNVSGSVGVVNMTGGTINAVSEMWVGSIAGAYGAFHMTGGSVNTGSWLAVGRNGNGYLDMSGGTLVVPNQNYTTASFVGSYGVNNLTGGTVNITNTGANQGGFLVSEAGTGILNISGTAALNISGARGLHLSANGGAAIANLNGGTVTTPLVQKGSGSGILNFNGGTLKASAASTTFFQGLTSTYLNAGGAIIDDGGFAITVAQPLLAPTGSGVSAVNVSNGTGYVGAPLVQISGDGTGATAVANIDANGNLTGITITNPGVNYTTASATLIGGGGSASVDSVNLATNVSGGFTKRGNGSLTLSGGGTYAGDTVVDAGTLALTATLSGTASFTTKAGTTLNVTGLGAGLSLGAGQALRGVGTVTGNVTMGLSSTLAPGLASTGALTVTGNLDLTTAITPPASAALVFELGAPAASDTVSFTTGTLTIGSGALAFDDFLFSRLSGFQTGTYVLFDGVNPINGTLDANAANLTGSLGGGYNGTLAFADNGNDLVLTVVPEPGTAVFLLGGLSLLASRRRRISR